LFLGLRLLGECKQWCEQGLAATDDSQCGSETELALWESMAVAAMYTLGNSDEVRAGIERRLELADARGQWQRKLYLLSGLYMARRGDFRDAFACAERSVDATRDIGNDYDIAIANWMLGFTHHLLGDHEKAQRYLELGFERAPVAAPVEIDFRGDHRARTRSGLARVLWLRGFPDRAEHVARQA
jgi:tetratricopeptide (TPR) repeat protein